MKFLRILVLASSLQACVSIGVTTIQSASPQGEDCPLAIYTAEKEIKKTFEVVCFLDVMSAGHAFADTTVAGAIQAARVKACQCGANGLLIHEVHREANTLWGRSFAMLKAIRYQDQTTSQDGDGATDPW
jgi:hypothetical protein